MLPDSLTLEVVTPERQLLHETGVREVQLPGLDGFLGILPGHAPLLTELGIGELSYRRDGQRHYAVIVFGFAEVLPDRVSVLAETAERAEEIDVERARAGRERAEKLLLAGAGRERAEKLLLAGAGAAEADWDEVNRALQRATVRLQAAAKAGSGAAQRELEPAP